MDNGFQTARATALMAANAYSLIQAMQIVQTTQPPALATFVVVIPALGLSFAYGMLSNSRETPRRELFAGMALVAMMLGWIYWQYNY